MVFTLLTLVPSPETNLAPLLFPSFPPSLPLTVFNLSDVPATILGTDYTTEGTQPCFLSTNFLVWRERKNEALSATSQETLSVIG